ncbi:MAG TPA: flavodoxin family protein [Candidatus Korarchaeota archaeon]|nr:flavodoxin family protein [Candidatus Korarchaeota archaeon]
MKKRLLIIYYTKSGNTKRMAGEIAKGAEQTGVKVEVKSVEECNLSDLAEADGIVIGSPTYFSNVSWQIKKLIDESIELYRRRRLKNKIGGCFTSSGTHRDGKDCIRMIELAFGLHHKMKMIPGLIRASGDDWGKISMKCREYGKKIAEKILLPNVNS